MKPTTAAKPSLEVKRYFEASPSRVYAAWTDPGQMKQWFGPEDVQTLDFQAEVRVGGKYRWEMVNCDGEKMAVFGEYLELIPERKVVFTWRWDDDEVWEKQSSIVTIELEGREGGTELRLRHEQLPSEESRDRHTQGWASVLNRLEKFVVT